MRAIIDSDTVAFACAASCEDHKDPYTACERAQTMIDNINGAVSATETEIWLSGKGNFRFDIYPEYKANRIGQYRPKWEQDVRSFMLSAMEANLSDGCEADDMVGIRHLEVPNSVICHQDKDIDMIPGDHYSWELTRLGKVVRPARRYTITEEAGLWAFYYQLLIGDTTDNVKGVKGVGPKTAARLLPMDATEETWFNNCLSHYSCYEELEMNAKVLWIWRKLNDDVTERWKSFGLDTRKN